MRQGRPLSNMAMTKVMRDLGYGQDGKRERYVPHGFRSSLRNWLEECTDTPHTVAEQCLAHKVGGAVERAYRRTDLFDRRALAMQKWADHCTSKGKVIYLADRDGG
jgi:integrase